MMNKYKISICSFILLMAGCISVSAQSPQTTSDELLGDEGQEIVDLGFGIKQQKKLSTAAVTVISGEELQHSGAHRLIDALYGKLLGLTALQSGGFEGDENKGAALNIRGWQTLSQEGRLVVQDGGGSYWEYASAPSPNSQEGILILVDGYERPIDRLTVEEVESVTVLKDAAAVAALGHEGINGAIMIRTKHGMLTDKNHIKVGYSHRFTFDPEFADMLNGEQYANALNRARANDGLTPAFTPEQITHIANNDDPFLNPNVNWKDKAFKNTGSEDNVNISFYGGGDRLRYYTLLDYSNVNGILNNTKQANYNSQLRASKANLRANMDYRLTETTTMSVNLLGIFMETKRPNDVGADDVVWYVYHTPATAFPYRTSTGYWGGSETYGDGNIAAKIQDTGYRKTNQRQLWANAKLTQDLSFWVPGLKAEIGAGYDNMAIEVEQRYRGHQYGYDYTAADGTNQVVVYGNREEQLNFNHWTNNQWRVGQAHVGLYYDTHFMDEDKFSAAVIYENKSEIRDGRYNTFDRSNWIGSAHYDFKNKYMADLVMAFNGSNRSYPSKWAFSPTISLGWIFIDANDADIINFGKLRGSFGLQHSDWLPQPDIWADVWNSSNGQFFYGQGMGSATWGAFITSFPTKNFSQQTATKWNVGFDLKFFKSLTMTADFYYQRRSHIMQSAANLNSWVVGIQSGFDDFGKVDSYGMELGLNFNKEVAKDLYLNLGAMMTLNDSKIKKYIETPAYPNLAYKGQKINEARGLQAIGFFTSEEDIANSPVQQFSNVQVGDIKYQDVNGDGLVNENDIVGLGKSTGIPAINYAFNVGLEYRGFGFNATFQGAGNYMKNLREVAGVWNLLDNGVMNNISQEYYNNSYDVAGASAIYPRLTSQSNPNNEQASSLWYKNVNFFKLRNVELYYHLPKSVIAPAKLTDVKVYLQGQNLLSSDNISAMDAEVLSTAYPVLKNVNIGLSVTF